MTNAQQRPNVPAQEMWDYYTEQVKPNDMKDYEQTRMKQMGSQGWELVNALPLSLHGTLRSAVGQTTTIQMIWKRRVG